VRERNGYTTPSRKEGREREGEVYLTYAQINASAA